ncbi:hypothetical protein DRE_03208 [Drechslerella stenobrocha 248]|uniref:Golgi to ER traffic protein 2 n=1 Tax=Drechslerella stenobrocha 248 TaxID=1043628 RepID=W7I604_9PEZI|nr:hypothetical protein DRE_03208 [Drechslerella stenobrocha 248]
MSDTTPNVPEQVTPSDTSLAQMTPLSVSEQARIRRELRKQKVGKGADRLRRITQTQRASAGFDDGYKDDATLAQATPSAEDAFSSDGGLDVSEHFYKPTNRARDSPNVFTSPTPPPLFPQQQQQQQQQAQQAQNEFTLDNDQFSQMMLNHPMFGGAAAGPGAAPTLDPANDPIMQMMQQMLGGGAFPPGADGSGNAAGAGGGVPPELLSGLLGAAAAGGEQPETRESRFAKWWSVLHILCSVLLGVYAALTLPERFTGTKSERIRYEGQAKIPLLWYFATMELVLQSTRYLVVERGGPPPGLILSAIVGFLPRRIGTTLVTLSHYVRMFSTVWQDGMVLLFTLGIAAWVNSWRAEEDSGL